MTQERKRQLCRIAALRKSDVLVFASDLNKGKAPVAIDYSDLLPIADQLANLSGDRLDVLIESPGGSGEVAEDIVRLLREKYDRISVIVPGWCKSAGTLIAMAADEILMGPTSALGPIDAQLSWQGKVFSADALLEGVEKIKREVEETGNLNRAYIPILQGLSPGELQSAQNALDFARTVVRDWLAKYRFRDWTTHSSTGEPVTDAEKKARADEIAALLCNHKRWLTHGRSIRLEDFQKMRLRITDYSADADLLDAITRYYTLLHMSFASNIYKLFETPQSQVLRFINMPVPPPQQAQEANIAVIEAKCANCGEVTRVQANLGAAHPLQHGLAAYPKNNVLLCPKCGAPNNLVNARRQIEAQTKKTIVA